MLDMKFVRENPDAVKENIKKKFQDQKLPLVDEVIALDAENRAVITEASELRAQRNKLSKSIGALMGQGKKEEAEEVKKPVSYTHLDVYKRQGITCRAFTKCMECGCMFRPVWEKADRAFGCFVPGS